jgi:hypothetical protein
MWRMWENRELMESDPNLQLRIQDPTSRCFGKALLGLVLLLGPCTLLNCRGVPFQCPITIFFPLALFSSYLGWATSASCLGAIRAIVELNYSPPKKLCPAELWTRRLTFKWSPMMMAQPDGIPQQVNRFSQSFNVFAQSCQIQLGYIS